MDTYAAMWFTGLSRAFRLSLSSSVTLFAPMLFITARTNIYSSHWSGTQQALSSDICFFIYVAICCEYMEIFLSLVRSTSVDVACRVHRKGTSDLAGAGGGVGRAAASTTCNFITSKRQILYTTQRRGHRKIANGRISNQKRIERQSANTTKNTIESSAKPNVLACCGHRTKHCRKVIPPCVLVVLETLSPMLAAHL